MQTAQEAWINKKQLLFLTRYYSYAIHRSVLAEDTKHQFSLTGSCVDEEEQGVEGEQEQEEQSYMATGCQ